MGADQGVVQIISPSARGGDSLDLVYICTYPRQVKDEWDHTKAVANLRKHGIKFADAATALNDPLAITISDERHAEEGFVTIGCDVPGRVLVVVYVWRQETIRIISARRAGRRERQQYEG